MKDEINYQVPPEGSLGLLALGHIGLQFWRKARIEYEEKIGQEFQNFYVKEKLDNPSALSEYLNTAHEA